MLTDRFMPGIFSHYTQLHLPFLSKVTCLSVCRSQHQHAHAHYDFGLTTIAPLSRLHLFILCTYVHVPVFTNNLHGGQRINPCLFVFNFHLSSFRAICVQDADYRQNYHACESLHYNTGLYVAFQCIHRVNESHT